MFLIYCHKNKINNKRYIGFTSYVNNPNRRWRDGLGYLNSHHKVFAAARRKAVVCLETGERWESVTEAAKAIGVKDPSAVSACSTGRTKTIKKLHLKYENQ